MVDVEVTGIVINRRTAIYEGEHKTVQVKVGAEFDLSIAVRTETTQTTGTARLTEEESVSLLTLLTAIEERLAEEIIRQ